MFKNAVDSYQINTLNKNHVLFWLSAGQGPFFHMGDGKIETKRVGMPAISAKF